MTGEQSATGIDMARGAELAVDQINSGGGVDGVKLSLVKVASVVPRRAAPPTHRMSR